MRGDCGRNSAAAPGDAGPQLRLCFHFATAPAIPSLWQDRTVRKRSRGILFWGQLFGGRNLLHEPRTLYVFLDDLDSSICSGPFLRIRAVRSEELAQMDWFALPPKFRTGVRQFLGKPHGDILNTTTWCEDEVSVAVWLVSKWELVWTDWQTRIFDFWYAAICINL